jgi:hypothetical protein
VTTPEPGPAPEDGRGPVHDYADGEIQTYAGRVNAWLIVLYVILALWAAYYLLVHWGGLGPGLEGQR